MYFLLTDTHLKAGHATKQLRLRGVIYSKTPRSVSHIRISPYDIETIGDNNSAFE